MSRPRKNPTTLDLPPFPTLTWDGYAWMGSVALPSWSGFQARLGPYGSVSAARPSDGLVQLSVSAGPPPPTSTSHKHPPSAPQAASYRDWLADEPALRDRILRAIMEEYNSVAPQYIEYGVPDLPVALDHPDQLRGLIGLSFIHVLAEARDGACYIGYEFGCEWDEEHGLGVMTHRGDVVGIGLAEAAFCPPYPREPPSPPG